MSFYESAYEQYTRLSKTLPDPAAQSAAQKIVAYLATGRDLISLYHKALAEIREQQGAAANLYQDFASQIECRFSPLTYTGDYCSFCGALNTEQLQAFLRDALARVTARLHQEAQVVDAYSTFLEEQTDEEIVCLCFEVPFLLPERAPARNREALLSIKRQALDHLTESHSLLEHSLAGKCAPQPTFKIGEQFCLSEEGLDNYGEEFRGKEFTVIQWYDHYTSEEWFNAHGWDKDPHGAWTFDEEGSGGSSCLYKSTFATDLSEWEMAHIEPEKASENATLRTTPAE